MSRKCKNVCTTANCVGNFLILPSAITGCISVPTFASLLGIPTRITSPAIGLKTCAIATGIKKYKSIIKKKKKKHGKIVKLINIEVLVSKALIDSNISHDELKLKQF